jgi:hypothetical protein
MGYLSQTVATAPGSVYLLSFWLSSPDGGVPNQFQASWNGTTLFQATNLPAIGWTNLQFLVSAPPTNSVLQFGIRDDPTYLGLDDVSLTPIPPPVAHLSAGPDGGLTLSWTTLPGLAYQVQYKTNFMQADWMNLGSPIQATDTKANAFDAIGQEPQRLYRVVLVTPQ